MNRGARHAPIFFDHECCGLFHGLLGELPERYNVVIHGYALMPNHVHLLLQTPNANLSRAMQFLFGSYARELNRTHEWDGPLFKGRFESKVVENEEYWRHLLAYIHLNPVKAGLVARLEEADWTSHAAYVGLERAPEWLYQDEMLDLYGTYEAYRDYLQGVQRGRLQAPDGFEQVVTFGHRGLRRGGKPRAIEQTGSSEDRFVDAMKELQSATGLSSEDLLNAPRGRTGNRARWVTAWWLRWRDRMSGQEVARRLNVSRSRISQMVAHATRGEELDDRLATWMMRLRATAAKNAKS